MTDLAPIVLIVYRREDHAKKTLDALSNNFLAQQSDLYIFSNAPKKYSIDENDLKCKKILEKEKANVKKVRDLLPKYQKNFKKLHIIEREQHLSANDSICSAVDEVIKKYGKVIVLEEDIITCKSFLDFMNQALNYYQHNKKVWDVFTCNLMSPKAEEFCDSFFSYSFLPWGWGTWQDRWEKVDWERKKENLLQIDLPLIRQYCPGFDTTIRHEIIYAHKDGFYWDYTFTATKLRLKKYTVFSTRQLSNNIGSDGSGENGCNTDTFKKAKFNIDYSNKNFRFSDRFIKDFYDNEDIEKQAHNMGYGRYRSPVEMNNAFYYDLFYQWIGITQENPKAFIDYLKKYNIKSVAIYGMGRAGNILYEYFLKYAPDMIKYAIDRSGKSSYDNLKVKTLDDDLEQVDVIIITLINGFYNVKDSLEKKVSCHIWSNIDFIYNTQMELNSKKDQSGRNWENLTVVF